MNCFEMKVCRGQRQGSNDGQAQAEAKSWRDLANSENSGLIGFSEHKDHHGSAVCRAHSKVRFTTAR